MFCGSSPGVRSEYAAAARQVGRELARRDLALVYGGASVGMMGHVARATLESGGEVIGVIPRDLVTQEVAFNDLADLRLVDTMHERKALMAELADGFIALPGGLGTIEEFFEVLTWAQLGLHRKPCGLLNVNGYYDRMLGFLDLIVAEGFMSSVHREMVLVAEDGTALLDRFAMYQAPSGSKAEWILQMARRA